MISSSSDLVDQVLNDMLISQMMQLVTTLYISQIIFNDSLNFLELETGTLVYTRKYLT